MIKSNKLIFLVGMSVSVFNAYAIFYEWMLYGKNDHEQRSMQITSVNNAPSQSPSLASIVYTIVPQENQENGTGECPICYENFDGINHVETICHHAYHATCLANWFTCEGNGKESCPICRKQECIVQALIVVAIINKQ
ncbi:MAG: RING finger domain-containing protein [Candidatus Babeliales bacterium]